MIYLVCMFAGIIVGVLIGASYYSDELFRLSEDNIRLSGERDRYRDAQDVFKTKQRMNWGA